MSSTCKKLGQRSRAGRYLRPQWHVRCGNVNHHKRSPRAITPNRIVAAVLLALASCVVPTCGAEPAVPADSATSSPVVVPKAISGATHDFISRTGIWIARPPSVVWPIMRNFHMWKDYPKPPRHISGPVGQVGEVLLASEGPDQPGREPERLYLQTVRVDLDRQLVLKLWTENGDDSRGYADLTLTKSRGGTQFTYCVYAEMHSSTLTDAQFAEAVDQSVHDAEQRFARENRRLKELAERVPIAH